MVREMLMKRSGAERVMMGVRMFDAAREVVIASLPQDLPSEEFKHRLFERIYGASMETVLKGSCSHNISDDASSPSE